MSERDGYEPGVPCWVDHSSNDPTPAAAFYSGLFGWDATDMMPPEAPGSYFICTQDGRRVAAVGSQDDAAAPAAWNTYVAVESVDAAVARVTAAGGTAFGEPFDVFDAGRMAIVADPAGAQLCLWQARENRGAQLVNEPVSLAWNEVVTPDAEGTKAFFAAALGWQATIMDEASGYTLWHPAGVEPSPANSIAGMLPVADGRPPHWATYFAVADGDATAARAGELGGAVSVAPFDSSVGRVAVLADPLGVGFGVIELR
jgi:uncharacterized protein